MYYITLKMLNKWAEENNVDENLKLMYYDENSGDLIIVQDVEVKDISKSYRFHEDKIILLKDY